VVYRVAVSAAALAAAAVTVAIVRKDPGDSLAGDSSLVLTLEVAAGVLLVVAGLVARANRGFRALLAASGIGWLIAEWNSPGAGAAFSAGLILYAAWPALLAHAALRYPDRSLTRSEMAALAVAYAYSLLLLGAGTAFFYEPVEQGCLDCPANRLLLNSDPQAVYDLGRAGLLVAAVWAAAFVALALVRGAHATPPRRWVEIPGSFRPLWPSHCSEPAPCTAASAAICPTTRRTEHCWLHRSPRSCWSPRASPGRACVRGACAPS